MRNWNKIPFLLEVHISNCESLTLSVAARGEKKTRPSRNERYLKGPDWDKGIHTTDRQVNNSLLKTLATYQFNKYGNYLKEVPVNWPKDRSFCCRDRWDCTRSGRTSVSSFEICTRKNVTMYNKNNLIIYNIYRVNNFNLFLLHSTLLWQPEYESQPKVTFWKPDLTLLMHQWNVPGRYAAENLKYSYFFTICHNKLTEPHFTEIYIDS